MISEKAPFFENFNRNLRKFFKIPEILPILSKINPYKKNRYNEANGQLLDARLTIWYRELAVWLIDVHLNGFLLLFVLWAFSLQTFTYVAGVANGITIWLIPTLISLLLKPVIIGAKDIVKELPRK